MLITIYLMAEFEVIFLILNNLIQHNMNLLIIYNLELIKTF